jgi:Uma2 family endonuclease
MVSQLKPRYTLADFEAFIGLPEHADQVFEYIGEDIVEVPSNPFVSKIAGLILTALNLFLRTHDLGHVTGEAGGYRVNGERYAPDVAFISYVRQPELAHSGYNPNPPELAVEVISDLDNHEEQANLRRKLANYLAVETLVWVVNPFDRYVEVYQFGKPVKVVDENGTLDGGDVLPGLVLPVQDIFPKG